jgi:hypothetical protein
MRSLLVLGIVFLMLLPTAIADGDEDSEDDESAILGLEGEATGEIAQVLLIGTLSIVVWKPLFSWLRSKGPELFDKEPRAFKKSLGVFNRRFMKVHNWIGLGAAVVGTIHGYVLEWHWTLWLAMAFMWVLVASGFLLHWKWPPREFRKGARLLHMQRAMSIGVVVLLLIGHAIVD